IRTARAVSSESRTTGERVPAGVSISRRFHRCIRVPSTGCVASHTDTAPARFRHGHVHPSSLGSQWGGGRARLSYTSTVPARGGCRAQQGRSAREVATAPLDSASREHAFRPCRRPLRGRPGRDELLRRSGLPQGARGGPDRPRRKRRRSPARARTRRRRLQGDPDYARPLGPPRRGCRPGRGHERPRLHGRGRARTAGELARPRPGGRPRTAVHRGRLAAGGRDTRSRRNHLRDAQSSGPLARAPRVPRRQLPLFRRRPLRRVDRPDRPAGRRLGDPGRVAAHAHGALPAGHARLLRARPADDAGRRARPQPLPGSAARLVTTFEAPRGTHDIVPSEQPLWRLVTGEAERLCLLYGYRPIQTPAFEDTALFQRTSGVGSDVVQKEMYTFEDRGGRSLTLRPEGTAPIARAYLEHGLHREAQPVKLYTIATMYRYSAPQRGRYREHWQLSVEAIGSVDPAIDAELMQLYDELLARLGVTNYELLLNSIGDEECRPAYLERLAAWLDAHEDVLDDEARQKRATNPLRVFDVKSEQVQEALADAPKIGDALCDECRAHFEAVQAHLENYAVQYTLSPTLVRGLDYYTRTAFEFIDEAIGAKSSIVGGGRYDGLIAELGGPPTPGNRLRARIDRPL